MTSPVSETGPADQAQKPIAVFLLDDHEIVRRGVRDLLEAEPEGEEFRGSSVATLSRPGRRWWRPRHPRAGHI